MMWRLWRVAKITAFYLIALEMLLATPLVARSVLALLQPFPAVSAQDVQRAAAGRSCAIVVLSAGRRIDAAEFGGATIDALSLERLRYGAHLARTTELPILLSGGGSEADGAPLAQLMAAALTGDYGLHARWLEERSQTTAENAIFSSQMLRDAGVACVVLVTHAWHMPRARAAFIGNGMFVIAAPTAFYPPPSFGGWYDVIPNANALRMIGYACHEAVGRVWYALRYGY